MGHSNAFMLLQAQMQAREADGEGADALRRRQAGHVRRNLYGGDGRDWMIVGIAGKWSYDVYGLHVAHDGKKEKKPLRAEWLVHELTDAGEEV